MQGRLQHDRHPGAIVSLTDLRVGLAGLLVKDGPPEDGDDALGAAAEHAEGRDHLRTPSILLRSAPFRWGSEPAVLAKRLLHCWEVIHVLLPIG